MSKTKLLHFYTVALFFCFFFSERGARILSKKDKTPDSDPIFPERLDPDRSFSDRIRKPCLHYLDVELAIVLSDVEAGILVRIFSLTVNLSNWGISVNLLGNNQLSPV